MSDAPKKKNPMVPVITGAISGGIECVSVWPMEFIKTQLQLQKQVAGVKPPYTGMIEGLSYTVRTTGFLSLYNGLGVTLVSFTSNLKSQTPFLRRIPYTSPPLSHAHAHTHTHVGGLHSQSRYPIRRQCVLQRSAG
jgi:hypothetical protein